MPWSAIIYPFRKATPDGKQAFFFEFWRVEAWTGNTLRFKLFCQTGEHQHFGETDKVSFFGQRLIACSKSFLPKSSVFSHSPRWMDPISRDPETSLPGSEGKKNTETVF